MAKQAPRKPRNQSNNKSSAPKKGPSKFTRKESLAKFEKKETDEFSPKRDSVAKGDRKKSHTKFRSNVKFSGQGHKNKFQKKEKEEGPIEYSDEVRLNKYIANAGISSRREADKLITDGMISIDGKVVTVLGTKVKPGQVVTFGDETVKSEKPVYVLLNKPKDFITTTKDSHERRTVMELVANACKERIYPVGRLDRNTTGLLLFTNDGDLAKKLTHPKHEVKKIYHVHTDKNVKGEDLGKLAEGVELDDGDGVVHADVATFVGLGEDKKQVGIELHSGKNRVVRRMFEALGYKVLKLDRVYFAGLTKKDLPRGRWKFLTDREIILLKQIG